MNGRLGLAISVGMVGRAAHVRAKGGWPTAVAKPNKPKSRRNPEKNGVVTMQDPTEAGSQSPP
jgi:hypothetical protein